VVLGAVIVTAALLGPVISESKRERAERERREAVEARADRLRQLKREARPRRGRGGLAEMELAITADTALRARAGELPTRPRRTECRPLGRRGGRLVFSCTAVTSDIRGAGSGVVGYPFRAALDPRTARFAFCKVSGRPGEGFLGPDQGVPLSPACG